MSINNESERKQLKRTYQKYLKKKPITKKEIKHLKNDNLYFLILKLFCEFSFPLNYQKIIKKEEIKTAMKDREFKRITSHLQFLISIELMKMDPEYTGSVCGRTRYLSTSEGRDFVENILSKKHH